MKKVRIKSAVPIYLSAAIWLLMGCIAPGMLLKIPTLLLTAAISCAAYFAGSKLFPGKEIEVREKADSGNEEINLQIEEGRNSLDRIRTINDQLPDPAISAYLNRMLDAGEAVFQVLEKDTSKASDVRRFMNYYLPTTEKIMANYVTLAQSPVKGENIRAAMSAVENSLAMIAVAFEKQLDSLYRDHAFDLDAEITVMEMMIKSEGLNDQRDFASEKNQQQTGV